MTAAAPTVALRLNGIGKRFDGRPVLENVDFLLRTGSVHALLGENGAGKSTLMRIAFGLIAPDAGTAEVFGSPVREFSARAAAAAGVGMVHQHLSLARAMTTTENLVLGRAGPFEPRSAAERLKQIGEESGLIVPPDVRVADLSIVQQQRLEVLKALDRGARILILDEPTAVLAPSEAADLLAWVRRFATAGGSVVLVTHKLRDALAVAEDVTVLRRGRVALSTPASGANEDALSRAMFPDAAATGPRAPLAEPGESVFTLRDALLRHGGMVARGVNLILRRREILGVAAVENSGHRALLAAFSRLIVPESGSADMPATIVGIPADRLRDALIPDFTLTENVALQRIASARGRMDWAALAGRTRDLIRRFSIAAPSESASAGSLSGGNQQRLVVARALERPVDLVVADNPTRGLDLQASAFVHEQLRAAAADGAAVVVHSSDVDEVLSLATRVVVVFNGVVSECPLDRDTIGRMMVGVPAAA